MEIDKMHYLEFIAALLGVATMLVVMYNEYAKADGNWRNDDWAITIPAAILMVGFAATLIRLWRMF